MRAAPLGAWLTPLTAAGVGPGRYLVQRAYPMLPRVLSENLCSLNEHLERLAFSVVWKLDKDANIVDQWMGRTVMRSCARLGARAVRHLVGCPSHDMLTTNHQKTLQRTTTRRRSLRSVNGCPAVTGPDGLGGRTLTRCGAEPRL